MIFKIGDKLPVYDQRCHWRINRLRKHILILRSLKRNISYPQNQTEALLFWPRSPTCIFYNNTLYAGFPRGSCH